MYHFLSLAGSRLSAFLLSAVILLLAGTQPMRVSARAPQFRHYTVADGLASTTVYSALQDRKGYLWLCTEAGVNRFNGRHFETYSISNSLPDNEAFKCFEDSKGRIWLATYNGKLCYFKDGKFYTEQNTPGLHYAAQPGKYLKHFAEDSAGNIWFSTFNGGIYIYNDEKTTNTGSRFSGTLSPMLFLKNGRMSTVIVTDSGSVLYRLPDARPSFISRDYKMASLVDRVHTDDPGRLTFVTDAGIESFRQDALVTEISNKQLGCKISSACMVKGDLWVGSYRNGLFCFRDFSRLGSHATREHFLGQASVSHITTDNEGGIWISTLSEGVYYLPATQSYITNIPTPFVTGIRHNPETPVWAAGTYYGDVLSFYGDSLIGKYKNPSYPDTRIKCLSWLSPSRLLVGMDFSPYIYDFEHDKPTVVPLSGRGTSDLYDVPGGTLICARSAIYYLDRSGALSTLFQAEIPTTTISYKLVSVAGKGAKDCWFANVTTVFHLDSSGRVHELAGPELLGANPIDLEYADDHLWVATHGAGVLVFKDGKLVRRLKAENSGLTSDVCQKILHDRNGNMWVATNRGVSICDVRDKEFKIRLTLDDVLIDNDVKDIDVHGRQAYIATPSGISIINTKKIISSTLPPPLYITALSANDSSYETSKRPQIPYSREAITLEFNAITFQSSPSLQYRYRAVTGDTVWHMTSTGQVTFYNLPPGDYDFLIAARKYNSDWSEPLHYGFTIIPRWYQQAAFKIACGILLLIVAFLLYRYQVNRIRLREAEKTKYHRRIADLEGSALANQMNPHFIFNSLNTVQQFVLQKEERQVLDYLSDFSLLMRQMLRYSRSTLIDLDSELDFLRRYLHLEQIRFNSQFSYSIELDDRLKEEDIKLPPMLIQPLLENAVKHGMTEGSGHVLLKITLEANLLVVTVDDNGIGIDQTRSRTPASSKGFESTALKVVESRLHLLNDRHGSAGLSLIDKRRLNTSLSGTIATLRIPLKTQHAYEGDTSR